ncbi:hypothetical protein N6L24_01865 [Cognatishimia sp. SS12]|uniref:hypothetical protein n=1 Tax=Cognatishimia sp. SS12 TaxID=2979465 RepID=UPI0023312926|nr:hypothetical protein [Cognatishimia sp. SS12]MDC0737016.1 hypothetical protein [Cognatishimia sp. SS12]
MAESFSLADHIFNAQSIADLAHEYAAALPGFDPAAFQSTVLAGFEERGFLERLEWIADCLTPYLADDFPRMADQLEATMVPELDPTRTDDDFGRFIHAVPGVLAVRHGLAAHPDRALDLLYRATKRFSMEFYIRPFLNHWPEQTYARLQLWVRDDNYHVRRLVSEGTRPKLPWAKKVTLPPEKTLPLLTALHGDTTRYVTRSVANHLNDIAKTAPDLVVKTLSDWRDTDQQDPKELGWMTRHALRTLVKQGHGGALALLGYAPDAPVRLRSLQLKSATVAAGKAVEFDLTLTAEKRCPVIVDYQIVFQRHGGKTSAKVFKLKQTVVPADKPLLLSKRHVLKADATTFRLYPGAHEVIVQVNGKEMGRASFALTV